MTKVTGPLLSMEATGSIGGAMTFARWKGRPYVRMLVKPSNPKSAAQTTQRAMMRYLSQRWATIGDSNQALWQDLADAGKFSTFNAFTRENLRRWTQGEGPTDTPTLGSTPAGAPTLTSATAGVKQITLVGNASANATGTVIYRSTTSGFTPTKAHVVYVAQAYGGAAYTVTDSGLDSGTTYYYRAACFGNDGELDTPTSEVSATAL